MDRREVVEGHSFFGYRGDGEYACECGHVVATSGLVMVEGPDTSQEVGVAALKEQWQAHLRDVSGHRCTSGVDIRPDGECGERATWQVLVGIGGNPATGVTWRCDEHVAWCVEFHLSIESTTTVHVERVP